MLGRARQPPDENVKPFLPPNQSNLLASHVKVEEDPSILEAWIISHWANSIHYAPISGQMLADMLDARKRPKREKPLLERFALLDPKYQDSIVSLCHDRSSKSRYGWMLIYLNETREWKKGGRWKRAKEFTHIQVVLKQRSHQMDDVVEVHEAKGSPLNPHDKKDDPYSGISNTAPTGPKPAPNGSSDFRSTKDVFHSGKHDQKHETVTRRRRYRYKGGSDDSKEPLLAEWVDAWVDILEVNRNIPAMLRPRTEIFKDAIDVRALVESGFEFTEKDDRFVVAAHLDVTELDKLYELTKDIRGVGDIPENPASLPISVGPVTKKPRVSWDIHEPGVSHAGDLHPDGRPKRSSFSQPGEDGFHLSRPRSWSPPIRGANESLQRFARNSEGGRLREPYHYSHSTRDPSRLRILPPPGPSDPSIGPGFGAPPSMPYSTYEDGEEIIYRHPRRIESQAFITNPPTSHLLEYGNERVESTTRFTPEVVERVRERARQLPQREREDQERYERGRSSIEERVRERERERYERGRSSMEERVRERERERDRERDRERYERDRPRSRERYRSSHQPTLHDDDYVRPRSIIRSEVDPYYPPRREGYTDYGPRRKLILGTIEKKINLLPSRTRHGDLDNTSDDDYSSLTMDDFDAPAKTSLRLPSQPRKSRAATMSSETEEEGVAETDSAIIEKQLALYRDDQSRNQNQNTPGAVTHIVRTESEDQSVETGPKEEDPSGRASEIGNPPPERSVSPKSSSSVVSGSTEEIVPRS